jgi:predicted patatin/cPLA2 family phospholipase
VEKALRALIVEGGAMRSVFSAGVLDGMLAQQFNPFDFYIGVSAGAFNLISYIAGHSGHSLRMIMDFALHDQFISYSRFLRGGDLLALDWLLDSVLDQSQPYLQSVVRQHKPLFIGVTDVATGEAIYVRPRAENIEAVIKASSALPLLYRQFPILDGRSTTDGGVADGIPVAEAIRLGAKQIMVIRSRHQQYRKQDSLGHRYIRWCLRSYPQLVAAMRRRVENHAATMQLIRNPPAGVNIVEICPPADFATGRFSRSRKRLHAGYEAGVTIAQSAIRQWSSDDQV